MIAGKFAGPLLASLLLAGCATTRTLPPGIGDNAAMVASKVLFTIPPPQALNETVAVTQTIVAHYRKQSFSFDAQIQITPTELELAALDGLGRRALTVTWKDGKIDYKQAPWLPTMMRPADILADIAIVYWPGDTIAPSLSGSGATLTDTAGSRRISKGKRDLIVVEYGAGSGWNRAAKLRNLEFGYEIDIQSAEIAP